MTSKKEKPDKSGRASIVSSVTTPLGFFVLALLVAEGILAANAVSADEATRRYLILGMMALVFCLVGIVAFLSIRQPTAVGSPIAHQQETSEHFRFSMDILTNVAEAALKQLLVDCSQDQDASVAVDSIVAKLVKNQPDMPTVVFQTAVQSHLILLRHFGAVKSNAGVVSPVSALGAGFLGSVAAHVQDGMPFLTGWDEHKEPDRFAWLRDTFRAIEERRLARARGKVTASRTIKAVIVLIKARYQDTDVYLMEYNPTWDGGMWWFVGGIVGNTRSPLSEAKNRLGDELGLESDSFHLIETPLVNEISDKRISERLGLLSEYTFTVIGAAFRAGKERIADLSHAESLYTRRYGKITLSRRYKWVSWPQIKADHPLANHADNILSSIEPHLVSLPISDIFITDRPMQIRDTKKAGPRKYDAIVIDAGGVLFKEEFWLSKLRRWYHDFRTALSPQALDLTFSHYAVISRNLSLMTQATPGTNVLELVRGLHEAYGAEWTRHSQPPRGVVLPGVLSALQSLRDKGIPIYVLTSATMSGHEFMEMYGRVLSDAEGKPLVAGCLTSRDLGVTKLCPHLYNTALNKWELDKQRKKTLMIAHDIHEILAARFAGGLSVAAVNVHYTEAKIARRFAHIFLERLEEVIEVV